jgi:predicted acetyltransferase
MKWSGNFYYRIRLSERKKGYGTKILSLALEEFRRLGFKEVYGQSSAGNIGSAKVIENNDGILLDEKDGTRYYKIVLK